MEDEEVIRQQMTETRASISEKLGTLEQQEADTGQGGKSAVLDSVKERKEAVGETGSAVKEWVKKGTHSDKHWLDLKAHVERHPWLMTGGALVAGYLLGAALAQKRGRARPKQPSPNGARGKNKR